MEGVDPLFGAETGMSGYGVPLLPWRRGFSEDGGRRTVLGGSGTGRVESEDP